MESFQEPTGRVKKEEMQMLMSFIDDQVKESGLDVLSVMIIAKMLYFKTKKLMTKPALTWIERRTIITAVIDWLARRYLDDNEYRALQPSINIVVPDTLDSMREFGKSKMMRGLCPCLAGTGDKTKPTNESMEADSVAKLKELPKKA